jgi:hypothetical protein
LPRYLQYSETFHFQKGSREKLCRLEKNFHRYFRHRFVKVNSVQTILRKTSKSCNIKIIENTKKEKKVGYDKNFPHFLDNPVTFSIILKKLIFIGKTAT